MFKVGVNGEITVPPDVPSKVTGFTVTVRTAEPISMLPRVMTAGPTMLLELAVMLPVSVRTPSVPPPYKRTISMKKTADGTWKVAIAEANDVRGGRAHQPDVAVMQRKWTR